MSLAGRVALITGGGRGIGAAIARRLASQGARIAVTGRTRTEIEAVATELGGRAFTVDLADRAATDRMLEQAVAELGRVDILVNNAGVAESASLTRSDDAMWDRLMAVNAAAPFRLTRGLAPAMVAAGWGRIVNIASNAGVTGYRYTAAYCAAKHAVVGMTRSLAIDLARTGVTINAVCPGWVATRMVEEATERIVARTGRSAADARDELSEMSPQGRMLEPAEVAELVAYLCSDLARGVHGQAMVIDGGQVLA